jgi:hypothetical protein
MCVCNNGVDAAESWELHLLGAVWLGYESEAVLFLDWKQLRPMILKRIKNRAKEYPIKRMIPVAEEVVKAREIVTKGVSTLLQVVPIHSCK